MVPLAAPKGMGAPLQRHAPLDTPAGSKVKIPCSTVLMIGQRGTSDWQLSDTTGDWSFQMPVTNFHNCTINLNSFQWLRIVVNGFDSWLLLQILHYAILAIVGLLHDFSFCILLCLHSEIWFASKSCLQLFSEIWRDISSTSRMPRHNKSYFWDLLSPTI